MKANIERILENSGVSPTAVRILVYRTLINSDSPLSLAEIETLLGTVDKSTISRTLSLFKEHHLVHAFNDGSSSVKYECCISPHNYEDDLHVHFHCEHCGKTECFNHLKIPEVTLPEGFIPHGVNYVVSGLCNKCSTSRNS